MPAADGGRAVLVGASTRLGQEVRRLLVERQVPLSDLAMVGLGEQVGAVCEYNGEARVVQDLDEDLVQAADLLLLAERGETARAALAAFRHGNGVAIDMVDAGGPVAEDPVVDTAAGPVRIDPRRPLRLRSPHGAVQMLAAVVRAVAVPAEVEDLAVTMLIPASESGPAGVEELHRQATAVMSFSDQPREFFGRQVAFNAVPHALLHLQQGWPDLDSRLMAETCAVLGLSPRKVWVRAVQMPVFHGTSMMLALRASGADGDQRRRRLQVPPFAAGHLTPAELGDSESVHVSDLGLDEGGRLTLWVVADNVKGSGVTNGILLAEAVLSRVEGKA